MTVIAAALRELIAAGVTGDALVTAVERIESASQPRRTPGALRQQRYRERHKASQSVTSDEVHIDSSSSSEIQKKKKKVSTPIADDASLSDADRAYALSKGWTAEKAETEFTRFRDHALANGRTARDWRAAWRNWVTSPYQKPAKGMNGHGTGTGLMDAFDDLIRRTGGETIGGGDTLRDVTPASGDRG